MLCGDFNLTLSADDRSNSRGQSQVAAQFEDTIQQLNTIDLDLHGRNFTWSNERDIPTFVRFDRFLITPACTTKFPNSFQLALPNPTSDHYPLLCQCSTYYAKPNIFHFKNYWLKIETFKDLVATQWTSERIFQNP
jgi:endonuclease/exonuclease/phosphatase family metal-dependent hydrolase